MKLRPDPGLVVNVVPDYDIKNDLTGTDITDFFFALSVPLSIHSKSEHGMSKCSGVDATTDSFRTLVPCEYHY